MWETTLRKFTFKFKNRSISRYKCGLRAEL
ncbi:hypothetical protein LSS_21350 [Leptospira santarosai serovar Shermani str. LT 821]|uniref:Uncharacterized protein n=1 Tax=Leptospira santarosai serovar Shermani str. LT 821 TaxID=758847 RepID=A0A097ESI6_9LEPT|nr:hypothetical protein LSS_21350 [Leptospira santarosai serovar Shermani str. LT 821]